MRRLTGGIVPLGAALVAFLFGAIMILALGASPVDGLGAMIDGAFGTGDRVAATAVRATPLLLVGAGMTIASSLTSISASRWLAASLSRCNSVSGRCSSAQGFSPE